MQDHYVENFVQSTFDAIRADAGDDFSAHTLVVGGDGRYYNREAIQKIVRLAAGNGFGRVLIGRGGIMSTPAVSAVIRRRGALGGLILSASHNPGGRTADFGIKYNVSAGGPAPESVTEAIYAKSRDLDRFLSLDCEDIDLDTENTHHVGSTEVTIVDPLLDYVALMRELFDFERLRKLPERGFRMCFDALSAVTGPYAHHIFEDCLGFPKGTVVNGTPLEDFGGHHPDPNLEYAKELVERMQRADAPDLGAASDGDGDRNMILGPRSFVSPGDSLAIITEHAAQMIPGYRRGLAGVARSMPTSTAVDRVAEALGVPCYATPTGWKFFGSLMDADKLTICGEESFGTGSNHIREKDGLWAILCWLSVMESTGKGVQEIQSDHWRRFGRSFYRREDYEALPKDAATAMMEALREKLPSLVGTAFAGSHIKDADDFRYVDPIDGHVSEHQGLRVLLEDGSRVVYRLSGTGTEGATLRIYLERYQKEDTERGRDTVVAPLAAAAKELIDLRARCEREHPSVVT